MSLIINPVADPFKPFVDLNKKNRIYLNPPTPGPLYLKCLYQLGEYLRTQQEYPQNLTILGYPQNLTILGTWWPEFVPKICLRRAAEIGHRTLIWRILEDHPPKENDLRLPIETASLKGDEKTLDLFLTGPLTEVELGTGIYSAAGNGHLHLVKKLIGLCVERSLVPSHIDIGIAFENAGKGGHTSVVKELSIHYPHPSNLIKAMQQAATYGHLETVMALPKEAFNKWDFHLPAKNGHYEIVCEYLRHIPFPENLGPFEDAIIGAAENHHAEIIFETLRKAPEDKRPYCRGFALIGAVAGGHLDLIIELLTSGPIYEDHLNMALFKAAEKGRLPVVQLFLKINESTPFNLSILGEVMIKGAYFGQLPVVQAFIHDPQIDQNFHDNGTDVCKSYREKGLHCAVWRGHTAIVQEFLANGRIPAPALEAITGLYQYQVEELLRPPKWKKILPLLQTAIAKNLGK